MRSFLKPVNPSTPNAINPRAAPPKARTPATPSTGGDVEITAELKLGLEDHGGRNGVPTKEGELAKVLEQYRDNEMVLTAKRAQPNGTKHLLSVMEKVCVQTGEWANLGDRGNEGNLKHLLDKHKTELARMQALANEMGKTHLAFMDDGRKLRRLKSLVQECSGYAGSHQLTATSEGHVGKLNESIRYVSKWVEEESGFKLKLSDVIIDRFEFAAVKIHPLRALRDSWVAFGSALIAFYLACERAHKSERDMRQAVEPPSKRQAVGPNTTQYICIRAWDAKKVPKEASQTFLPMSKDQIFVLMPDKMSQVGWTRVKRISDGATGYVPQQRIKEHVTKSSWSAPELSDEDDDGDMDEQPELEVIQAAVDAVLEEEDSFSLDEIMDNFAGYGKQYRKEKVEAALQELCANGPPGDSGVVIIFDSDRDVYVKADDDDDEAEKDEDEDEDDGPFTEEELKEFLSEVVDRNKDAILAQDFDHKDIYDEVDQHFDCNIRELGWKKFVKQAFLKLAANVSAS